jgi:hypothetical protein
MFALIFFSCNSPGNGTEPEIIEGTRDKPNIIDVTLADSQITIQWNSIEEVVNYEVYVDGEFYAETISIVKVIKNLINGQSYFVQVRAVMQEAASLWGDVMKVQLDDDPPPIPPQAPSIKVIRGDSELIPLWEPVKYAISYEVYLNDTLYTETEEPEAKISGLTNGTDYTVNVLAKNNTGISSLSNTVTVSPNRYLIYTNIGMGFNLFGPLNNSSVSLLPILNQNKLNADGAIILIDDTHSIIHVATGEQIRDIQKSMNTSIGMGVSVPFKAITFSGGISSAFKETYSQNNNYKYATVRGEHYIKIETLSPMFRDPYILRNYITDGFIHALKNEPPTRILQRYGHVIVLSHYLGGSRELYYQYHNEKKISTNEFRTAVNTSVRDFTGLFGAEAKLDYTTITSTFSWQEDSDLYGRSNGGSLAPFMSMEQFFGDYNDWISSIYDTPVFAGITGYSNSFIPIWEIAEALGEHNAANRLHEEFINQVFRLAEDLENSMPGEWFSIRGEEYTSSNTFTLPKQYVNTDQGRVVSMVKYIISLAGGGGGGQGSGISKGDDYAGGGGGSGSLAYISFMTNEDTRINLTVGKGGKGTLADENRSSAHVRYGSPGGDGENTSITWNGVTITASGGKGGGYGGGTTNQPNTPNGDARGGAEGTASISGLTNDIISRYGFFYLLQDGNPGKPGIGSKTAGAGGTAEILRGFTGCVGGRGGGGAPAIHGSDGENGSILIRYYSYLGD